jgi:acyl-CoA thioesterase-1
LGLGADGRKRVGVGCRLFDKIDEFMSAALPDHFVLQAGQVWVCLGDSITEDPAGYVSICEREIKNRFPERQIEIVNAGVSGDKASDMLARFGRDVLSYHPDFVSISVGVNDVWHGFYDFDRERPRTSYDPTTGNPLEHFSRDLERMAEQLAELGIQGMLVAPTVIGDDPMARENAMLRQYIGLMVSIADKYNFSYCPMNDLYWKTVEQGRRADAGFALTTDGVHMNLAGANMMAVGVLSSLGFYAPAAQ